MLLKIIISLVFNEKEDANINIHVNSVRKVKEPIPRQHSFHVTVQHKVILDSHKLYWTAVMLK